MNHIFRILDCCRIVTELNPDSVVSLSILARQKGCKACSLADMKP